MSDKRTVERLAVARKVWLVELLHSGKVRDVYADGDDLVLVASDRISIYDVILPTPIPDKGKILTQLSLWWFEQLADVAPNHIRSATDVPAQWQGRAVRCEKLRMIMVECIARGYLAGSGIKDYDKERAIAGNPLPDGLTEGSRLPEPIFTPSTKVAPGQGHDETITYEDVVTQEGPDVAAELKRITLEVYKRGSEVAAAHGIIIADTKIELGFGERGITLADELLTPDSSRFLQADEWSPDNPPRYLDKQFLRDWSTTEVPEWKRTAPGPAVPDRVVEATRNRYVEVYEKLTGDRWS